MGEVRSDSPAGSGARVREAVSTAIAYWEPLRIAYHAVLALVVLTSFAINCPRSRDMVSLDVVLMVFVLAVLANVCYCAAYVGDVFVQLSGFRDAWQKWRWGLFIVGTA